MNIIFCYSSYKEILAMYIIGTVILSFMFLSMQHVIDAWYMFKSTISNTECTVFDILRCPELTNQP